MRGRPKKFTNPDEFHEMVMEFFKVGKYNMADRHISMTGLADYLDIHRDTLYEYEKDPDFSDTIKKARQKCELHLERQLFEPGHTTGAIFALKCNYGWIERANEGIDK